ncbi:MAG: hypothetical protein Ct9H300mP16_05810 [Pseudomonadota bacterium]|nr:MAG: hypothetical protein Ct9H300mP16_05810 [Pseudomonadota bacterium]
MAGLLPAAQGQVLLDGEALEPALQQRQRDELQKFSSFSKGPIPRLIHASASITFWAARWSFTLALKEKKNADVSVNC